MKPIAGVGWLVALSAGCLPSGPPPAGRQIVGDRQASLGAMVPPDGDGVLRVLFFRPNATVLAPEFTVTAFAEPRGSDLLAPGARVVYQYQARTASPYDGLWLVNSP